MKNFCDFLIMSVIIEKERGIISSVIMVIKIFMFSIIISVLIIIVVEVIICVRF